MNMCNLQFQAPVRALVKLCVYLFCVGILLFVGVVADNPLVCVVMAGPSLA